jgi:hypothetical protein
LDKGFRKLPRTKIVIESYSSYSLDRDKGKESEKELDKKVLEHLINKKDRKLMSKQDKLALVSASDAWKKLSLENNFNPDRVGIYFCVGILPFEDRPLQKIAEQSQIDGQFDYQKFSKDCFESMNPLLTFKCLPNMPLYHISFNLGVTGRYLMTYPGHQDLFGALERAIDDLNDGIVDYAIIGGACDQNNVLVQHHLQRCQKSLQEKALDCSATLVLSKREPHSNDQVISNAQNMYSPYNPFESINRFLEKDVDLYHGATQMLFELIEQLSKEDRNKNLEHKHHWAISHGETLLKIETIK